jgi:hypothetical protein
LVEKKIEGRYEYLGDYRKTDTDDAFGKLDKSPYDAVIRIKPRKLEEQTYLYDNTTSYQTASAIGPDRMVTTVTINDFDLSLTETSNNTIWEGRVKTTINASKTKVYKKISMMIVKELTKNKIIPAK